MYIRAPLIQRRARFFLTVPFHLNQNRIRFPSCQQRLSALIPRQFPQSSWKSRVQRAESIHHYFSLMVSAVDRIDGHHLHRRSTLSRLQSSTTSERHPQRIERRLASPTQLKPARSITVRRQSLAVCGGLNPMSILTHHPSQLTHGVHQDTRRRRVP